VAEIALWAAQRMSVAQIGDPHLQQRRLRLTCPKVGVGHEQNDTAPSPAKPLVPRNMRVIGCSITLSDLYRPGAPKGTVALIERGARRTGVAFALRSDRGAEFVECRSDA
jgi:hypothetical protein